MSAPAADGAPYLPTATADCPTFTGDSDWQPLIDGAAYFTELDERLAELQRGDSIVIAGFEFNGRVDLRGRAPGETGYVALGYRLARLAADGVDVRVVLAGERFATILPIPAMEGFRRNVKAAKRAQAFRPSDSRKPPLRGRVFLDKSGPLIGSNHLKSVAIVHQGVATAFVGGIDLTTERFDRNPHDRMRQHGRRWGWHDVAVRVTGPAAARVHRVLSDRWRAAAASHDRWHLGRGVVETAPIPQPTRQRAVPAPGVALQIARSAPPRGRRIGRPAVQRIHEVFDAVTTAIDAASRYIYIEDQYLQEETGGLTDFELYPKLRAACARGVKLILVGSGVRDAADPGLHLRPINRAVNRDVQHKIIDELDAEQRANVVMYRVRRVTVHAKVVLIDDRFACVGSANMFSRSMSGVDRELSTVVATTTDRVRDLRVALWAEHWRTPVFPALLDLDVALGAWRPEWRGGAPGWRPDGYAPAEKALVRLPERQPWWKRARTRSS